MKLCFVRCSKCGKQVSNAVESYLDEGMVVRAWVECPECLDEIREKIEEICLPYWDRENPCHCIDCLGRATERADQILSLFKSTQQGGNK